ncbi:AN1-type zinc finger protein 2A [Discoglossus pictus]
MEFPDLGQHCSESMCKQLDFLPLKCDACEDVFCKYHITYDQHQCPSYHKKNIQVPVCPLCNVPVPVKRGEMADIAVGQHMDRNCSYDPLNRKQKVFTNRCFKAGCKKKELLKITCDQCHNNYCISHRHPLDHNCKAGNHPLSKAGNAALNRAQKASKENKSVANDISRPAPKEWFKNWNPLKKSNNQPISSGLGLTNVDIQNVLSDDEALQKTLELSLLDTGMNSFQTLSLQEEDAELALTLEASREEYKEFQRKAVKATGK